MCCRLAYLTVLYTCPVLSCPTCPSYRTVYLSSFVMSSVPVLMQVLYTRLSYCAVYLSRLVLSYLTVLLCCIPVPSCPVLPDCLTVLYTCPVLSCPTCLSYRAVYLSCLVLSYLPVLPCCIPVPFCPVLLAYLTVLYTCPVLSCPTCLSYRAAYLSRLNNKTLLASHLVRAQDAYKDIRIHSCIDLFHLSVLL